MIEPNAYGMPNSGWMGAAPAAVATGCTCAVRATGAPVRIWGWPRALFTRQPEQAATQGHPPARQDLHLDPTGQEGAR